MNDSKCDLSATAAVTPTNDCSSIVHSQRTFKTSTPLLLTPNYLPTPQRSPMDQSCSRTACSSSESQKNLVRNPNFLFRGSSSSSKNGIFKSTNRLLCQSTVLETISENLDDEQQPQEKKQERLQQIEETKQRAIKQSGKKGQDFTNAIQKIYQDKMIKKKTLLKTQKVINKENFQPKSLEFSDEYEEESSNEVGERKKILPVRHVFKSNLQKRISKTENKLIDPFA
ncbi:hypothetical protein FGO68_gene13511 [Halteria grandinella]|uniref:Uncharacterized protein n=1 Tax=Halteria grandinella TaxID=5974 RepID=A0A8J8NGR0_HALGN|nr:hypothetical protein FGO68_gene13511 [Halteria grandinella]